MILHGSDTMSFTASALSFMLENLNKPVILTGSQLPIGEIRKLTNVLSRIIDSKSRFTREHSKGLSEKAGIMAEFYKKSDEERSCLRIAADLHDLGKLAVSNSILDKPGKLDLYEIDEMQQHTYLTRQSLQEINGFENITEWASNHHEKLNGTGYPYRKKGCELDSNSRLMACLDIYQALTEERPYRIALKHTEAMDILHKMQANGLIDGNITNDINSVFI